MKIPQNPFNDALQTCLNNIEEFKKRVEKESELKNSLLSQMANFYTDNFQNTYFKEEKTKSPDYHAVFSGEQTVPCVLRGVSYRSEKWRL